MADLVISIIVTDSPDLPGAELQTLYRLTGRSTPDLRDAIRDGSPLYTAALFGAAHLTDAPRLEKTIEYLLAAGIPFRLEEAGADAEVPLATLDEILGGAESAD